MSPSVRLSVGLMSVKISSFTSHAPIGALVDIMIVIIVIVVVIVVV